MSDTGDLTRPKPHCDSDARATGDLARPNWTGTLAALDPQLLTIHPDDLLGNESVRFLCAHYLGQEQPVGRPTLIRWRKARGFPAPLPCGRAGVELWDARQVRAWIQEYAQNLPATRPTNLRGT